MKPRCPVPGWNLNTTGVLVATKGGRGRSGDGSWTVNGHPEHLKRACEQSLKRLGVSAIGLYQLHKPDPAIPFAESVGAIRDLLDDGKIRMAGVSNTDASQIRLANDILDGRLVAVQNEFSPAVRRNAPELRLCAEMGIAFLPWSPLGGISRSALDSRPRATGPDPAHAAFHTIARHRSVSPQQVCLAWLLAISPTTVPIPGASRPDTIRDSAMAAVLTLSAEELALLSPQPVPAAD